VILVIKKLLKVMFMAGLGIGSVGEPAVAGDTQILELRQYQLAAGTHDAFVDLFETKLVESQEEQGMRLVGQFSDHDDKDRFTWIRSFADMAAREKALTAFYSGPVWKANRDAANPMLLDNDNVLLLKPVSSDLAFGPAQQRSAVGVPSKKGGAVLVVIEYLWKMPNEGFSTFFRETMKPALENGGLKLLGAYLPADEPNNFPALPIREEKKLLVWFVHGESRDELAKSVTKVMQTTHWRINVAPSLRQFEERSPQLLWLDPTSRSALR
jgi:quinol monooxygenase YgiN